MPSSQTTETPNSLPEFLVFQLYGNLASWGDIAVGEHRPSQAHPSKSAITGLIGAALGLRRNKDQPHIDLNNHYGVAICVQAQGELMRDYHTTQVPAGKNNGYSRKDELTFDTLALKTILSQRDYQMDAYYLIGIWQKSTHSGKAPYSLSELTKALNKPIFTTSLGRKSCPPCLPYNPKVITNLPLKQACESYIIADDLKNTLKNNDLISWYWEDGLTTEQLGMQHTMSYPRRDQIKSRKRWQFLKRNEYYFSEPRQGETHVL